MADPKDGESFFRKVVRFVANPATDWSEVNPRNDEEQDLERSELKAMVERKRRNDFVRKREFDTLRRLRRDGLTPEQLAALGGSSKVDDSEVRLAENSVNARADGGVKAKIDEIEMQMVGDPAKRTNTGVCFVFQGDWYEGLSPDQQAEVPKRIVKLLEGRDVAYDFGGYRDAPPSLRVWCGGTVEQEDLKRLLPWIEWAYEAVKTEMAR